MMRRDAGDPLNAVTPETDPPGSDRPITLAAIRESPRTPGRYQLLLSDGRKFVVGVAAISDLGLSRTGLVLDQGTLARLARESAVSALASRAVAMLARARRSRRELERRLQRFEPDMSLVSEALQRLDAQGLLGDADVARAEAGARLRRGDGPSRIRQELRRKGLDEHTAKTALRTAIDEEEFDEPAACRRAADRRFRALVKLERTVAHRRLTAFLLRRGFASSIVQQVVRDVIAEHH